MAEPLLKIQSLSKRFGGVTALNDVSFSVPCGIIKAIIGPNGAGKTTLFNVIAGNLQPTSGMIHFEGSDVTRMAFTLGASVRTMKRTLRAPSVTAIWNVRT